MDLSNASKKSVPAKYLSNVDQQKIGMNRRNTQKYLNSNQLTDNHKKALKIAANGVRKGSMLVGGSRMSFGSC